MAIKIVPVADFPETVMRRRKELRPYIEHFLALDVDIARVDFTIEDYIDTLSCANAFNNACMIWSDGRAEVKTKNNQVFLVRKDPTKRRV